MVPELPSKIHATARQAAPLIHMVRAVYPVNSKIEEYLQQHSYPLSVKKGCILHKEGDVCDYIYFISKGVVRGYLIDDRKDITTWITTENEVVSAIHSFNFRIPAMENLQAVENCELLAMSYADLHRLYDLHMEYSIVARRIYEKYYADAEIRALIARLSNAERKYEFFLQAHTHLANRIPIKYIASYLGISLETLSRIRGLKRAFLRD